jgi:hypothetical protein
MGTVGTVVFVLIGSALVIGAVTAYLVFYGKWAGRRWARRADRGERSPHSSDP